jgi:hypothetical protein
MRSNRHPAHSTDVFEYVTDVPGQRIWRLWQSERDHMTAVGTDFDGIDAENSVAIYRSIRTTSTVSMIGEDNELQTGTASGRSNFIGLPGFPQQLALPVQ